jgi:integral membrane protein
MKMELLRTSIGRVRWVGWLEGVSWLILLFVAMPMKYMAANPAWVKVVGPIHGALFVALMLVVGIAWIDKSLKFKQALFVMIASVVPFGTFLMDRHLARASD